MQVERQLSDQSSLLSLKCVSLSDKGVFEYPPHELLSASMRGAPALTSSWQAGRSR